MTAHNDLDRTLGAWFQGDATTAPPSEPLARAIESTGRVRPRAALVAGIGSSWVGSGEVDGSRERAADVRPAFVLTLMLLLALALAAGALLVGGALLKPTPHGSSGNGVIAVAKDGDILVADRPGGDLRPLVTGPEDDANPMFSPDGSKLAFVRQTGEGDPALMLADADGTNLIQFPPESLEYLGLLSDSRLSFSPDGRSLLAVGKIDDEWRVVVRSTDPAAAPTVLDVRLDGSGMLRFEAGQPSFNPTNSREILAVGTLDPEGPRGIQVFDLATGEIRTIREQLSGEYIHDVAWLPDGKRIAYGTMEPVGVQSYRVVAPDGSGDQGFDALRGQVGPLSNDGTRIVAEHGGDGQQAVIVPIDGVGEPVVLGCGRDPDVADQIEPSPAIPCPTEANWVWSPDDSMLIGIVLEGSTTGEGTLTETYILADAQTGHVTELGWRDVGTPAWQRVAAPGATTPPTATTAPPAASPGQASPLVTGMQGDGPPLLSPDGSKLVFIREGSLMFADADGTNVVPVTLGRDEGRVSPDGRSEVELFRGESNGVEDATWHVAVSAVDRAADRVVLDVELHDGAQEMFEWGGPEFRPTSSQEILIVGKLAADGPRGIYVYDLVTNGIRTVLEPAGYVYNVYWTPDGNAISYDLAADTDAGTHVVAADGSHDRPLLKNAQGSYHALSRWSDDGALVVLARPRGGDGSGWQPVVVSTSGDGEPVVLACGGSTDISCPLSWTWSPDDSLLIGSLGREDPADLDASWTTWMLADPRTGTVTQSDWEVDLNDPTRWRPVKS